MRVYKSITGISVHVRIQVCLTRGRIQNLISEPDLKDCQTALTPLMNTFYCIFKLQCF